MCETLSSQNLKIYSSSTNLKRAWKFSINHRFRLQHFWWVYIVFRILCDSKFQFVYSSTSNQFNSFFIVQNRKVIKLWNRLTKWHIRDINFSRILKISSLLLSFFLCIESSPAFIKRQKIVAPPKTKTKTSHKKTKFDNGTWNTSKTRRNIANSF